MEPSNRRTGNLTNFFSMSPNLVQFSHDTTPMGSPLLWTTCNWRSGGSLATFRAMDSKRLEIKVGLFVLIGLVLMGVLLIQFSKGTSVFHGTYTLRLHAANVGGLKQRASV